jgi:hypothetical protein
MALAERAPRLRRSEGFDAAELVTEAVRRIAPSARERGLSLAFDVGGPDATVAFDVRAMRSSTHRLLRAATQLIDSGCVDCSAELSVQAPGKCVLSLKVAGFGVLASDARVAEVLRQLELRYDGPADARLRRARGHGPTTGAPIEYSSHPCRGIVLGSAWTLRGECVADAGAPADAAHAPAWIVHDDVLAAQSLQRRLERLGWCVCVFDAPVCAVRRWQALPPARRPAAVIALEGSSVSPTSVQPLAALLGGTTRAVYGVLPGSPVPRLPELVRGFEVRLHPFSPRELGAWTAQAAAAP